MDGMTIQRLSDLFPSLGVYRQYYDTLQGRRLADRLARRITNVLMEHGAQVRGAKGGFTDVLAEAKAVLRPAITHELQNQRHLVSITVPLVLLEMVQLQAATKGLASDLTAPQRGRAPNELGSIIATLVAEVDVKISPPSGRPAERALTMLVLRLIAQSLRRAVVSFPELYQFSIDHLRASAESRAAPSPNPNSNLPRLDIQLVLPDPPGLASSHSRALREAVSTIRSDDLVITAQPLPAVLTDSGIMQNTSTQPVRRVLRVMGLAFCDAPAVADGSVLRTDSPETPRDKASACTPPGRVTNMEPASGSVFKLWLDGCHAQLKAQSDPSTSASKAAAAKSDATMRIHSSAGLDTEWKWPEWLVLERQHAHSENIESLARAIELSARMALQKQLDARAATNGRAEATRVGSIRNKLGGFAVHGVHEAGSISDDGIRAIAKLAGKQVGWSAGSPPHSSRVSQLPHVRARLESICFGTLSHFPVMKPLNWKCVTVRLCCR